VFSNFSKNEIFEDFTSTIYLFEEETNVSPTLAAWAREPVRGFLG
jgi:hypothetical protein